MRVKECLYGHRKAPGNRFYENPPIRDHPHVDAHALQQCRRRSSSTGGGCSRSKRD
jgi:hypothetical protein